MTCPPVGCSAKRPRSGRFCVVVHPGAEPVVAGRPRHLAIVAGDRSKVAASSGKSSTRQWAALPNPEVLNAILISVEHVAPIWLRVGAQGPQQHGVTES